MENSISMALPNGKLHQIVAWSLLAGLLLLRLPFLAGIALFANPGWLAPAFEVGTYLLTACLIWWERDRLAEFNIDTLALGVIILFKPIETLILAYWNFTGFPLAFPNPLSFVYWVVAPALLLALWLSRPRWPKLSRKSFRWFGLGILAGLVVVILLAFPMSLQAKPMFGGTNLLGLALEAVPSFFYQLGYAAVTEEPLFRGFLWGYLRLAGWKNRRICLLQAGLFMLGHIYYIAAAPISMWIIIPAGGLVLGGLVWRSKTISSSLAAHATLNALGMTAGIVIASLRA